MKKKVKSKKKKIFRPEESILLYNALTSVRFELKEKVYEIDIGGELLVDGEDLHSQVERIPAIMGYFGSIVLLLEREHRDKEALKKKIEAKIDRRVREAGIIGETRIDKAIKRHPKWLEAVLAVSEIREKAARARNLQASLKEKAMVLLSRSADIRSTPSDSILGVNRKDVIRMDKDG